MNKRQTEYIETLVKAYEAYGSVFPVPQEDTLKKLIEYINNLIKQAKDGK